MILCMRLCGCIGVLVMFMVNDGESYRRLYEPTSSPDNSELVSGL